MFSSVLKPFRARRIHVCNSQITDTFKKLEEESGSEVVMVSFAQSIIGDTAIFEKLT